MAVIRTADSILVGNNDDSLEVFKVRHARYYEHILEIGFAVGVSRTVKLDFEKSHGPSG
jgi:voltage-gated potassium channel Kch